jgi:hypothetical protein
MDQGTAYIVTRLDKITELQRDQGEMLARLLAAGAGATTTTRKKSLPEIKLSPFWQSVIAGGVIWAIGLSTKSFLDHGGNPAELIGALLKLLR